MEELSINQTLDETSHEHSSNGICRLRHGLNVNCLLKVFDYLEIDDLIQLCRMDPYFKELIINWTIKKKMIKLPKLRPTKSNDHNTDEEWLFKKADHPELIEMFETFGKSLGKFTIHCSSLSALIELIMEYCEPHTLTEIVLHVYNSRRFNVHNCKLDVDEVVPIDQKLLDESMPFFSNLRKFSFYTNCVNGLYATESDQRVLSNFLAKILSSAKNLETLKTSYVDIEHGYLKHAYNLRELRLMSRHHRTSFDDLVSFLKMINSKLKIFKFVYFDNDLSTIGDVISESCPNLEQFSEQQYSSPYSRFDSIINRYNFLSTLSQLKEVTLTSYTLCGSDLYYPLKGLAKSNIVKLKIFLSRNGAIDLDKDVKADIMKRWLPDFTNIQTVSLLSVLCYGDFEFIFHFTKHLKNLKTFRFETVNPIADIHKVLEFAPSIQTLDLTDYLILDVGVTIKNILETLRRTRQLNGDLKHLLYLKLAIKKKHDVEEFCANTEATEDIMSVSYSKGIFDCW